MVNKATAEVAGKGNITVELKVDGRRQMCILKDVLHVPDLGYQFVPTLENLGLETLFKHARCRIKIDTKTIASGTHCNGLYHLDLFELSKTPVRAMVVSLQRWHERLAHVDQAGIKRMVDHRMVKGAAIDSNEKTSINVNGCIMVKAIELLSPIRVFPELVRSSISYTLTLWELLRSRLLEAHATSSPS